MSKLPVKKMEIQLREYGVFAGVPILRVETILGTDMAERRFMEKLNEKRKDVFGISLDVRGFVEILNECAKLPGFLWDTKQAIEIELYGSEQLGVNYLKQLRSRLVISYTPVMVQKKGVFMLSLNEANVKTLIGNGFNVWLNIFVKSEKYVEWLDQYFAENMLPRSGTLILPEDSLVRQRKTKSIKEACLKYGFRYGLRVK